MRRSQDGGTFATLHIDLHDRRRGDAARRNEPATGLELTYKCAIVFSSLPWDRGCHARVTLGNDEQPAEFGCGPQREASDIDG